MIIIGLLLLLLLLLCIAYLSIHNFEDRVTLLSSWNKSRKLWPPFVVHTRDSCACQ